MKHAAAPDPSQKKKSKVVVIIFLVIFIGGFCFGAFMLGKTLLTAKHEQDTFDELHGMIDEDAIDGELSGLGHLLRYDQLYALNHDFFGWLKIEDTKIDYPVMYTPTDSEYYLHRDFFKNYSESGMLFVDGDCPAKGNYYLIYGHHMLNGTMFGKLPDYGDYDYYQKHKIINFDTLYERRQYEVCAVFYAKVYDVRDEEGHFCYYNYKDLSSQAVFDEYVANIKQIELYDTGITPQYGDELIALSTCNYHTDDGRFVVVARRIKDEKQPATTAPTTAE